MGVTYSIYQDDEYKNFEKNIILDLYKNNKPVSYTHLTLPTILRV